jgi:Na+/H+ antiporter NhaD/arsenite permease-like protein
MGNIILENINAIIATVTFLGVIIVIMLESLHLTVAAMLGTLILIFTHVLTLTEAVGYISNNYGTLALFFGVMVLVRAFAPTKIFDYLATKIILLAKGEGKLILLGIVAITTPICAILPNATTVILLAPLIPPIAMDLGIDFVPLLILMVLIANSAGLLTIVGDPVSYMVGDAINISFTEYLLKLSLGGAIAILTVVLLLPWLFKDIWQAKFEHLENLPHPQVNHPRMLIFGGIIVTFVLIFFVIGDSLPIPISPAAIALLGATLALLLSHHSHIDTVHNIFRDIDWSTLIFFMSTFVLIGALEKTGVISGLSSILAVMLGKNILIGCIVLMFVVGLISSVVPNIPLVAAMIPLVKEYVVMVGMANQETLSATFSGQFPPAVLPLFYALLYGASLGGNGTLVGASANIVAAGIAEQYGERISFHRFLRYGLPIATIQIFILTIYVLLFVVI